MREIVEQMNINEPGTKELTLNPLNWNCARMDIGLLYLTPKSHGLYTGLYILALYKLWFYHVLSCFIIIFPRKVVKKRGVRFAKVWADDMGAV